MNRADVVDLVVDLVDVDLDVDLVDVDLIDVDLIDVDLVDVDIERAIDKKEIKTRAPDVRLTHRLVHSASFFKTKTSKMFASLNSIHKSFQNLKIQSPNSDIKRLELFRCLKSSFDASDRPYSPD